MKKQKPFLKTPPPAKELEDKLIRTGQTYAIKQWVKCILGWQGETNPATITSQEDLENLIVDICGDGDGPCEEAIISCVQVWRANVSASVIKITLQNLVDRGVVLFDGTSYVDPIMRPNAAARVRAGGKILSYD